MPRGLRARRCLAGASIYIGKRGRRLGQVEATSEREAIAKAPKEFNITPAPA